MIRLTNHVKERRKKGIIPEKFLLKFAQFQEKEHCFDDLNIKINDFIILTKGGCKAVFVKKENYYLFVTFFGKTGWIINDEVDYSGFTLKTESADNREKKKEKQKNLFFEKYKKFNKVFVPKFLLKEAKDLLSSAAKKSWVKSLKPHAVQDNKFFYTGGTETIDGMLFDIALKNAKIRTRYAFKEKIFIETEVSRNGETIKCLAPFTPGVISN